MKYVSNKPTLMLFTGQHTISIHLSLCLFLCTCSPVSLILFHIFSYVVREEYMALCHCGCTFIERYCTKKPVLYVNIPHFCFPAAVQMSLRISTILTGSHTEGHRGLSNAIVDTLEFLEEQRLHFYIPSENK